MGEPMDYIFQMTKHSGSINPWYQPLAGRFSALIHLREFYFANHDLLVLKWTLENSLWVI